MPGREREYARGMKWEYKTLCLSIRGLMVPNVNTEEIDSALGRLGRDGWELVSALDTNSGAGASFELVAIFKRPRDA
jgi:hypothetical protein